VSLSVVQILVDVYPENMIGHRFGNEKFTGKRFGCGAYL